MPSTDQMGPLEVLKCFLRQQDNSRNYVKQSSVPEKCRSEPCMVGVDEAGRGPVLGPMVYGVAYCLVSETSVLKNLGCADSKALTEEKRDEIYCKMVTEEESRSNVGWIAEVISPNYISNSMYRRAKHSLNEVSMNSAISLIKQIVESGVNITEVYVDTVGPPEKYQAKLGEIFSDYKITVAKKADSLYPIVSAASIVAKVTRDHALKVWSFREGLEISQEQFGSGYPGDPLTKKFISEQIDHIFGYPLLVRFSWSTAENMLLSKAAECTFDDADEDVPKTKKAAAAAGTKKIGSFFSARTDEKVKRKHKFFGERFLSLTNAFD